MSEANFATLRETAIVHRLPKHARQLNEGQRPCFLHLLVEGSVETFGCHDG